MSERRKRTAKKKAPQTAPRKDTKRGCLDCTHYPMPNTKEPCKSCERLSNWQENNQTKK